MSNEDKMEAAVKEAASAKEKQSAKNAEAVAEQDRADQQERARTRADEVLAQQAVAQVYQDAAERAKLRALPPITQSVLASTARPGEETVKMLFPRPQFIWAEPDPESEDPHLRKRYKVHFGHGVQNVPVSLADNDYLKRCGVRRLDDLGRESADPKKGPTIQEWVVAGYDARKYPPKGYDSKSSQEEIDEAVKNQDNSRFDNKGAA